MDLHNLSESFTYTDAIPSACEMELSFQYARKLSLALFHTVYFCVFSGTLENATITRLTSSK